MKSISRYDETMSSDSPTPIDYAIPERRRTVSPLLLLALIAVGLLLLFVVVLPALHVYMKRRGDAVYIKCGSNMKWISQAIGSYSKSNGHSYPPDLATLLATQGLSPNAMYCPSSNSVPAAASFVSDPAARAANNLDFIYVGEGLTNAATAEEPILFERLSDHGHRGGNVLYGDGHVEWEPKSRILKLLEPLRGTPRLTEEEYAAIIAK